MGVGVNGNLIPAKPGEVRNPKGINQYSYKREAERIFDKLLLDAAKRDKRGRCRLEIVLEMAISKAEKGDGVALDQILKRVLPVTTKHEVEPGERLDASGVLDRLAALADRRGAGEGCKRAPRKRGSGA